MKHQKEHSDPLREVASISNARIEALEAKLAQVIGQRDRLQVLCEKAQVRALHAQDIAFNMLKKYGDGHGRS